MNKIFKVLSSLVIVSAFSFALIGCSQQADVNSYIPEQPEVSNAQEALKSGYIQDVCAEAQDNFENLGLDPENDYAYWMTIKQMINPEGSSFINSLMMEDLDSLKSYKTTFDGVCNVILGYDYVDKANLEQLKNKIDKIYEFASPFCNSRIENDLASDELTEEVVIEPEATE